MKFKIFKEIDKEYEEFYRKQYAKGSLGIKSTETGFFGFSICREVFELFKRLKLDNYNNFIDLGSGDGRVVLIASLFTSTTGVETDEELFELGNKFNKKLKTNANFELKDFIQVDLSQYDIIFINPDKPFYRGLEPKLLKEMKKNALLIIYGNHFLPQQLKLKKKIDVGTDVVVYCDKNLDLT